MYAVGAVGLFLLLVSLFLLRHVQEHGNWAVLIIALVCLAGGAFLVRTSRIRRRK